MSSKATVTSVVGVIVAALVGVYMYVYALKDVINNVTLLPGIAGTLMQNLFVIMYFLAIALLPIAILYKAIKGSGK